MSEEVTKTEDQPKLTDRQREVYDFIIQSIKDRGCPPTLREIGKHIGSSAPNAAVSHITALINKGYITRSAEKSRGLRVVAKNGPCPVCGHVPNDYAITATDCAGRVDQ
jgi:SOS-response transcriptional repressor LexA